MPMPLLPRSRRYAGAVCAVAVVVAHEAGIVYEVPAVDVVGKSVTVVVAVFYTVGLAFVGPYVVGKVGMLYVYTGVEDGNDGALAVDDRFLPEFVELNCGNAPLLPVHRFGCIVGSSGADAEYVVWFGIFHFGQSCEVACHGMDIRCFAAVEADQIERRQVAVIDSISIEGPGAQGFGRHLCAGERHEFLGFGGSVFFEKGVEGFSRGCGTEFAFRGLEPGRHSGFGLEFHYHFALSVLRHAGTDVGHIVTSRVGVLCKDFRRCN